MAIKAYSNQLENEILSADPLELVRLLYRGATDGLDQALQGCEAGDIQGRSRGVAKACAIINELMLSLDHSAGADASRNLTELYDYMQRRLAEANFRQPAPP